MSQRAVVLCGVPTEHCIGARYVTDQQLPPKCHASHSAAFNCMKRYLVSVMGYEQIGSRDFRPPDGGPIRILTKRSKYGARLRTGKMQERFMPEDREAGNRGVWEADGLIHGLGDGKPAGLITHGHVADIRYAIHNAVKHVLRSEERSSGKSFDFHHAAGAFFQFISPAFHLNAWKSRRGREIGIGQSNLLLFFMKLLQIITP